jgi:hypothetical protein
VDANRSLSSSWCGVLRNWDTLAVRHNAFRHWPVDLYPQGRRRLRAFSPTWQQTHTVGCNSWRRLVSVLSDPAQDFPRIWRRLGKHMILRPNWQQAHSVESGALRGWALYQPWTRCSVSTVFLASGNTHHQGGWGSLPLYPLVCSCPLLLKLHNGAMSDILLLQGFFSCIPLSNHCGRVSQVASNHHCLLFFPSLKQYGTSWSLSKTRGAIRCVSSPKLVCHAEALTVTSNHNTGFKACRKYENILQLELPVCHQGHLY